MSDADSLREEAWVVRKVEGAGEKTALLKNVGDVANWARVAGVDVDQFWRGGCSSCGWRWKAATCLLRQGRNGNAVEVENVIALGGIVPFDVSKLAVVTNGFVSEATVEQQASDIGVLGFVGCVELIGMVIHPKLQLLLWFFPKALRRVLPENPLNTYTSTLTLTHTHWTSESIQVRSMPVSKYASVSMQA